MGYDNPSKTCGSISPDDLAAVLKFLTVEEREELCNYLEYREYPANSVFIQEGETGGFMGFLVSGRLEVKKATNFAGKYVVVAILERGAMVGEMAVIGPRVRAATVLVKDDSRLLILTSNRMEVLTNENPRLGIKLLKRILYVLGCRLSSADERLSWLL